MSTQVNTVLYDGELLGIRRYAVRNWSGKIYVVPRNLIKKIDSVVEFINNPCIYILKGYKDNLESFYIGETDDPITTLIEHRVPEEDYWSEAVLFFNDIDDKLSKGISKYLESALYRIAKANEKNAFSFNLMNTKAPRQAPLALYDEDMAKEFLDRVISVSDLLGIDTLFNGMNDLNGTKLVDGTFYLKNKVAEASGARTINGGFIVFKDSVAAPSFTFATSKGVIELGNALRKNGVIVKNVFVKDYEFNSPSLASSVVAGYSSNGYKLWKNKDGKSIAELEEIDNEK